MRGKAGRCRWAILAKLHPTSGPAQILLSLEYLFTPNKRNLQHFLRPTNIIHFVYAQRTFKSFEHLLTPNERNLHGRRLATLLGATCRVLGNDPGTYVYMYMYRCVYRIYVHMYIYIYITHIWCVYIYNTYVHVYIYIYIYIYMYTHIYIHTYIHACMHACIHTYIHDPWPGGAGAKRCSSGD